MPLREFSCLTALHDWISCKIFPYMLASGVSALSLTFAVDCRIRSRGNEEERHLGADDDWNDVGQCDELCRVEQKGGVGCRTSHQTLKGNTFNM